MLAKIFRPTSRLLSKQQPAKRLRELHEFLCIREATNPQVSKAMLNSVNQAAKDTNLTPQQVTEIIAFLNYNPAVYADYFNNVDLTAALNEIHNQYRHSQIGGGQSYEEFQVQLESRYPQIVELAKPNSERAAAIDALDEIFIKDGPKPSEVYNDAAISRYINQFQHRAQAYVQTLNAKAQPTASNVQAPKEHPTLGKNESLNAHIQGILEGLIGSLRTNPSLYFGHIRAFIDSHRNRVAGQHLAVKETAAVNTVHGSMSSKLVPGKGTDLELEERIEVQSIVDEYTRQAQQEVISTRPWINDRRVVYEAQIEKTNTKIWSAASVVSASALVWQLIQQEIGLIGLTSLAAVTAYTLHQSALLAGHQTLDKLVQINVHRDGKHIDLFIESSLGTRKIEDVPVQDFKLHKGNYNYGSNKKIRQLATDLGMDAHADITLETLRKAGLNANGWVATYGDDVVLVPFNYVGNVEYVQQIFGGKNVLIGK